MENLILQMDNSKNGEFENLLSEFDFLNQVHNITERDFWTTWEFKLEDESQEDLLLSLQSDVMND